MNWIEVMRYLDNNPDGVFGWLTSKGEPRELFLVANKYQPEWKMMYVRRPDRRDAPFCCRTPEFFLRTDFFIVKKETPLQKEIRKIVREELHHMDKREL
jgi:hypothetical protein